MKKMEDFRGKKVLVTGHTGFKGSWLCIWLLKSGAEVIGYALPPKTVKDNFYLTELDKRIKDYRGDIRDKDRLNEVLQKERPEIVFHLAAQPLVFEGFRNPQETFDVNIMGTVNILEAFRQSDSARVLVIITTDKVYENHESAQGYREEDRLGGSDPYSASKAAAELVAASYIQTYFGIQSVKRVVTARAGNVIGGGDWSNNRIIPDCIRALENGEVISIRNPQSVRPWQHVLEPLYGYLLLAATMQNGWKEESAAFNFGPKYQNCVCVEELVKRIISRYGKGQYRVEEAGVPVHETKMLMLDIERVGKVLHWSPVLSIDECVDLTTDWYQAYQKENMFEFCMNQIDYYENKWSSLNNR